MSAACQRFSEPVLEDTLKPTIDERVELMSVLARLAKYEEYTDSTFISYVTRIETYFAPFRNSEVVEVLQDLRDSTHLAYDGIMQMAVNLEIEGDKLTPIMDISQKDERWSSAFTSRFYRAINTFYSESDFHNWFQNNSVLYDSILDNTSFISNIDQEWFYKFFGSRNESSFRLILAPGNGYGNYGPSVDSKNGKTIYSIIGCTEIDATGIPFFSEHAIIPTIIHEFSHSFVNPLIESQFDVFEKSSTELYTKTSTEMQKLAYGDSKALINESIVRACVIRYMMNHDYDPNEVKFGKIANKRIGFYWISELVELLGKYEKNRETYPKMTDFIVELNSFFEKTVKTIAQDRDSFLNKKTHVIQSHPISGGVIDANTKELSFTFDHELLPGYFGFGRSKGQTENYPTYPRDDSVFVFSNANRTITIKQVYLEPNKDYKIKVIGRFFNTTSEHMGEDYILSFKTR